MRTKLLIAALTLTVGTAFATAQPSVQRLEAGLPATTSDQTTTSTQPSAATAAPAPAPTDSAPQPASTPTDQTTTTTGGSTTVTAPPQPAPAPAPAMCQNGSGQGGFVPCGSSNAGEKVQPDCPYGYNPSGCNSAPPATTTDPTTPAPSSGSGG